MFVPTSGDLDDTEPTIQCWKTWKVMFKLFQTPLKRVFSRVKTSPRNSRWVYDSLILTWSVWVGFCDWGNDDWFFNVGLGFSILAPARTSGNVLYGLYTMSCNCDRFMLQWPAQLPILAIAGGNHRFLCARVQRDRGRRHIRGFRELGGGKGCWGTQNRKVPNMTPSSIVLDSGALKAVVRTRYWELSGPLQNK